MSSSQNNQAMRTSAAASASAATGPRNASPSHIIVPGVLPQVQSEDPATRPLSPTAAVHPMLYNRAGPHGVIAPMHLGAAAGQAPAHGLRHREPAYSRRACAYANPLTGSRCRAPFGKRHDMYRHVFAKHVEEEYRLVSDNRIGSQQAYLCRAVESPNLVESQNYLRSINCELNEAQMKVYLDVSQRRCPTCGMVYARRDSMLRHLKQAHNVG
ncbi:hypothetical protein BKA62DRAFT_674665 [Auriculariales sp. MPI-PUGE-AT-0066]|nr:hypothetical protein BKA62DRAFT_674665 [Auriculariales sp. MPI-PUGE-AT-0066]